MLRISVNESEENVVTLRLEGQIVGAWISELDEACERRLAADRKLILDLGDVSLIDRRGLSLLSSLSHRAVALVRCSPFQEEQLRLASLSQSDKTSNFAMSQLQTLPDASSEPAPQADPNRWVDDHGDCLFRYALLRVRIREVAEDLVQESLLAAMRQIDKFGGRSSERLALRDFEEQGLRLFPKARARDELYRP